MNLFNGGPCDFFARARLVTNYPLPSERLPVARGWLTRAGALFGRYGHRVSGPLGLIPYSHEVSGCSVSAISGLMAKLDTSQSLTMPGCFRIAVITYAHSDVINDFHITIKSNSNEDFLFPLKKQKNNKPR